MKESHVDNSPSEWAESEFGVVDFGDKRLSKRLLKIADSFAHSPELPINQACEDWHQSKAAYIFFQNGSICEKKYWRLISLKRFKELRPIPLF